mmetsp:Transcript_119758/g.333084  ORF Transcript_119758/g.333084 Transcript_119758/m.333084 type:complete len:261 (-) Transcript_119758:415-1197(-)
MLNKDPRVGGAVGAHLAARACTGVQRNDASCEDQPLHLVDADACGEAKRRPKTHSAAVPQVAHALHAHQRHPRDAPHGEDGAPRARSKRHELPQRIVGRGGRAEHADRRLHERHVVDDGRGDAEQGADEDGAVAAQLHEEPGVVLEDPGGVEGANGEQHTGEKQQACQVHLVEGVHDAAALRALVHHGHRRGPRRLRGPDLRPDLREALEGDGVGDEPEDAERQEHAQVRGQACGHLQHRDHKDARDSQQKHGHLASRDL